MALFPLHPDGSARHHRNHILLLAAAQLLPLVYFWAPLIVLAAKDLLPFVPLLTVVAITLVIFLQLLLLQRLLTVLGVFPAVTAPVERFLYESRLGSGLLLFLCAPWCVVGAYGLILSSLFAAEVAGHWGEPWGRKTGEVGEVLSTLGRPMEKAATAVVATAPLVMTLAVWWVWRVAMRPIRWLATGAVVREGRGMYEPVGLEELGEGGQRMGDARPGMSWAGRASLFMGSLPR